MCEAHPMAGAGSKADRAGDLTSASVRRPLLMQLAGRSGMSYLLLWAALLAGVGWVKSPDAALAWFLGVAGGLLAFDCWGGVRISEGMIRFRKYVRCASVPVSSVAAVNAYRAVGVSGMFPVVTLKLKDGSHVRVSPMATISMSQARSSARNLAALIGASPPTKNWDGG